MTSPGYDHPGVIGRRVLRTFFEVEYDEAVVYGDVEEETVLHRGPVLVRANGWVELPGDRLLSPDAVHHVDPADGDDGATDRWG